MSTQIPRPDTVDVAGLVSPRVSESKRKIIRVYLNNEQCGRFKTLAITAEMTQEGVKTVMAKKCLPVDTTGWGLGVSYPQEGAEHASQAGVCYVLLL